MYIQPQVRNDGQGSGYYKAPRGARYHKGIDFEAMPGHLIKSHVAGRVSKLGICYADDHQFKYVEIIDYTGEFRHRFFYVLPAVAVGDYIEANQVIGNVQNIAGRYPKNQERPAMVNHVHYEVLDTKGADYDPMQFLLHLADPDTVLTA